MNRSKPQHRPTVAIVKYPSTLGGSNSPAGLGEAPDYLLQQGLKKRLENLGFAVEVVTVECPKPSDIKEDGIYNLSQLAETSARAAAIVETLKRAGVFVLTIGGGQDIDIGILKGLSAGSKGTLVATFGDGHFDCNTDKTSITGNPHGMTTAVCVGHGHPKLVDAYLSGPSLDPKNIFMWGQQTDIFDFYLSDERERNNVKEWGIPHITKPELDAKKSIKSVLDGIDAIRKRGDEFVFVLDMDVMDGKYVPGVAMPNPDGMSGEDLQKIADYVGQNKKKGAPLVAMNVVEIVPKNDREGKTAALAMNLICLALQSSIKM